MGENPCLECPVRGDCCYLNAIIGGINILLENVPCPHLDTDTGLCTVYEHRDEVSWCLTEDGARNTGGLPRECLYVKEDPSLEENPKRRMEEVMADESIPFGKKGFIAATYNRLNYTSFKEHVGNLLTNEVNP